MGQFVGQDGCKVLKRQPVQRPARHRDSGAGGDWGGRFGAFMDHTL